LLGRSGHALSFHTCSPSNAMRAALLLALAPAIASALAAPCISVGDECTGGLECCNATSKCEPVNAFYSKCVFQPTCAAAGAQCKGKGDSVMEPTPCCDAGFVCRDASEWWSSCVNASTPVPPPPPPPAPKSCSKYGEQCASNGALPCCDADAECEMVNQYFSKCVQQPACVAENALCEGTGDHVMKRTSCCDADHSCVPWGDEWSVCREAGATTCSNDGEQCAGTGGSAMQPKPCCDASQQCVAVNQYYSACASPPLAAAVAPEADRCPGLERCPRDGRDVEAA